MIYCMCSDPKETPFLTDPPLRLAMLSTKHSPASAACNKCDKQKMRCYDTEGSNNTEYLYNPEGLGQEVVAYFDSVIMS